MPSAKASGADTGANGAAKSREHNQGNQDRKYTVEQKAAVIRVRKCQQTAFYEILGLEEVRTTCTETEIKKAYRKLSLLTHPDKNGHEHADEAFKMVSRAFGVLGDPDKKKQYDRTGGDPDSRFGSGGGGAPASNPFSGFTNAGGARAAGGRGGWDDEMSPEEMFNRFFGGGGMGGGFGQFGGGMFDTGPQFVFNMGGGPGIRVHQFGGARPRRRPRDPNAPADAPASLRSTIMGLLPLLILFVFPLLNSLFSGSSSTSRGPHIQFDNAKPPYTMHRMTPKLKVDYFVNPTEVADYTPRKFNELDKQAEISLVQTLRYGCTEEQQLRSKLMDDAQGWFFQDGEKMHRARNMEMKNCKRLEDLKVARTNYY